MTAGRDAPGPPLGRLHGLRWWPFIVLGGAGLIVLLTGGRGAPLAPALSMVWLMTLAMMLAVAVFLEWSARVSLRRQRLAGGFDASPEAARVILDANAGLARVVSLVVAVFVTLLVMPQTWLPGSATGRSLGLGLALIAGLVVWAMWAVKAVHGYLERHGMLGGLDGWNGYIYRNPDDPRLWVPKLSGIGATLNFAHAWAWIILGGLLGVPLTGAAIALVMAACR